MSTTDFEVRNSALEFIRFNVVISNYTERKLSVQEIVKSMRAYSENFVDQTDDQLLDLFYECLTLNFKYNIEGKAWHKDTYISSNGTMLKGYIGLKILTFYM